MNPVLPISEETLERALEVALAARAAAYARYSQFRVGAALVCADGSIVPGCNVENISFGLTLCAERAAVCRAVVEGKMDWIAIVVVSDSREPVSPCGACRQVLAEFAPALPVIAVNLRGDRFLSAMDVLLPRASSGILG